MPPDLSTAEQLAEIEAIKQLKARYFRLMDTKDWEGFAKVFASDVEVDVMFDWVELSTPKGARGIRGYGHYHETYEKRDGSWVITTLRLTRLRVDPIR
jgi:hypothetical protein